MHRSRLSNVVVDCSQASFEAGTQFWAEALGRPLMPRNERYATLKGRVGGEAGTLIGFQKDADGAPTIHLDIETDDVEAEVARLEKLGARIKRRVRGHVIMQAPSGHAFCVVPVQRGDFPAGATEWP